LYGAQERRAWQGVAGMLMGQFGRMDARQQEDEYRRQMSNAKVAVMRERYNLSKLMAENAKDPTSWLPTFQKSKGKIRDAVLKGVTMPDARRDVELELNEELVRWEADLFEKGKIQSARNAVVDYEAGLNSIVAESREYPTVDDALADFEAAAELIENNEPTPEAADFKTRWAAREIFGDYLIQEALRTDDPSIVEKANEIIPKDILDGEKPLFGPEELGALTKRYDGMVNAAKAEVEKARKERAAAFDQDITMKLLSGQFTEPGPDGKPISLRDVIVANRDITGATKRTLEDEYDKQVAAFGKGDVYNEVQKLEAVMEIQSQTDPEERLQLLKKHAAGLGWTETKRLYEKYQDPTRDNSLLANGLKSTITAMRNARTQFMLDDEKEVARAHVDSLRLHKRIVDEWDAHPDWTDKQRIDAMEAALIPAQQEIIEEVVEEEREKGPGLFSRFGRFFRRPSQEPKDVFADIWDDLTEAERTALTEQWSWQPNKAEKAEQIRRIVTERKKKRKTGKPLFDESEISTVQAIR
jgi:hypothetical protein